MGGGGRFGILTRICVCVRAPVCLLITAKILRMSHHTEWFLQEELQKPRSSKLNVLWLSAQCKLFGIQPQIFLCCSQETDLEFFHKKPCSLLRSLHTKLIFPSTSRSWHVSFWCPTFSHSGCTVPPIQVILAFLCVANYEVCSLIILCIIPPPIKDGNMIPITWPKNNWNWGN